jgi:hypothetical protein
MFALLGGLSNSGAAVGTGHAVAGGVLVGVAVAVHVNVGVIDTERAVVFVFDKVAAETGGRVSQDPFRNREWQSPQVLHDHRQRQPRL